MAIDRAKLDQITARLSLVKGRGEEATKQALVLPMLDALGYDIWNPSEVCPEFESDFAIKKQGQKEKVDLAILLAGVPRVYFEVKPVDMVLDGHEGQLARYFNATPTVSLAVITNGIEYRFYTDTGEPNLMDSTPFHTFRIDAVDQNLDILFRFHRTQLSADAIREYATELNYTAKVVAFLKEQLDLRDRDASDNLVRWILSADGMYEGVKTNNVLNRFRPIIKNSLQLVLRDIVRRSVAALDEGVRSPPVSAATNQPTSAPVAGPVPAPGPVLPNGPEDGEVPADDASKGKIVTTERELVAFQIVRQQFSNSLLAKGAIYDATARREVPIELGYKDTQAYLAIYFNKPGWWVARLVVDVKNPWVALSLPIEVSQPLLPAGFSLLPPYPWAPTRIAINGPDDLHALNRVLFAAMQRCVDDRRPGSKADATSPQTS